MHRGVKDQLSSDSNLDCATPELEHLNALLHFIFLFPISWL